MVIRAQRVCLALTHVLDYIGVAELLKQVDFLIDRLELVLCDVHEGELLDSNGLPSFSIEALVYFPEGTLANALAQMLSNWYVFAHGFDLLPSHYRLSPRHLEEPRRVLMAGA